MHLEFIIKIVKTSLNLVNVTSGDQLDELAGCKTSYSTC